MKTRVLVVPIAAFVLLTVVSPWGLVLVFAVSGAAQAARKVAGQKQLGEVTGQFVNLFVQFSTGKDAFTRGVDASETRIKNGSRGIEAISHRSDPLLSEWVVRGGWKLALPSAPNFGYTKNVISAISHKRKRGRPRVGSTLVGVTVPPKLLSVLDEWIGTQPDPKPSRPEAIRKLLNVFFERGKNEIVS